MNDKTIGEKIREFRKAKNMSQDDLATASGIYLSTIKKYENGSRNPKPDQLLKIAEAIGVSINMFLDFEINTVSDVISLVMKLDDQTDMTIQAQTDKDDNIIPNTITFAFSDENINDAIASYLRLKENTEKDSAHTGNSITVEDTIQSYEEMKNRLLLFNERIKKSK
jgi:transcriptional regulator with XRE-family HTH domain